jgi:hypothetical protein
MRRLIALLIGLAALAALAWVGVEAARRTAPARLRAEVEGLLVRQTHAPVEIGELRLVWGLPIELHAEALRLYEGQLTVERAQARIDVFSLLTGHPRLTRLRLDGAELRLTQASDGSWKPQLGKPGPQDRPREPWLSPLRVSAGIARFLLARPVLADTVVVQDGHLSVTPAGKPAEALRVRLDGLEGTLQHSRLQGIATLELKARWVDGRTQRAALEWQGRRGRDGRIALSLKADSLDLGVAAPGLQALVPGLVLRGRLDGVVDYQGAEPGSDRFALAATLRDLEARAGEVDEAEWLRVPRARLDARVAVDPERLALSDGRLELGEWSVSLDGLLARPLRRESKTSARLAIESLHLDPEVARALTGWLPPSVRERARSLVSRLRDGRLVRGQLTGEAPLGDWGEALAGRLEPLLPVLQVSAELERVQVALDAASALEDASARLDWSAGTLEIHDARARLDGEALPLLDVRFRGLAQLLASAQAERAMQSSAKPLLGVAPLVEVFRPAGGQPSAPAPPIALELDYLDHPALLWPLEQIRAAVEPRDGNLRVAIQRALWAGVPIDAEVVWASQPERRLEVVLEAHAPAEAGAAPAPELVGMRAVRDTGAWAAGWIDIGESQGSFRQRHTRARLRAQGAQVRFDDLRCELVPAGGISGALELDLSRADAVPYALDARLEGGDLGALLTQRGVKGEPMNGALALGGKLAGSLRPGQALLHDADGDLTLAARDGTIPKTVPPVLALALASDSLNPFASRERIRYSALDSVLRFSSGKVSTQALEIEGPDLRLFASGEIDLRQKPNALDAEIALFLFRQLDWALVKIPIVSQLLLGENKNLVAAYFRLVGSWQEPVAKAQPLRTVKDTAGGDILEGIPRVMIEGMKAIGGLLLPSASGPAQKAPEAEPGAPPAGS